MNIKGDRVTNEYGELYKAVVTHVSNSKDKEEIGEETAVTNSFENDDNGIMLTSVEDEIPTTSKWIKLS